MLLMMVVPAGATVFCTSSAGDRSPVCRSDVFETPLSPDTAGRLRGASSAAGTHGVSFPRSRFATAGMAVEVDAGSSAGTHGAGSDFVRSRFAGTGAAVVNDAAGTSGGTHGAGTLPASSRRKIDSPVLRSV